MTATQSKKIVVVGGVAGGASTAARIKRLDETADVVVFEKGGDVSFSNCSLPYYLSGTVENSEDLIMMTSAAFRKKHDIDVRVHAEVLSINSWAFLDLSQFNSVVDAFCQVCCNDDKVQKDINQLLVGVHRLVFRLVHSLSPPVFGSIVLPLTLATGHGIAVWSPKQR